MLKLINKLLGRNDQEESVSNNNDNATRLLKLGFISEVNLAVGSDGGKVYALEPSIFLDVCEKVPEPTRSTTLIIVAEQCDVIIRLMDTFGLAGLAAWVKKTLDSVTIRTSITETTFYHKARLLVDVIKPIPSIVAINDTRTSYRVIVGKERIEDSGLRLIPDEELSPNPHHVTASQVSPYADVDKKLSELISSSDHRHMGGVKPRGPITTPPPRPTRYRSQVPSGGYPSSSVSSFSGSSSSHVDNSTSHMLTGMMYQKAIDDSINSSPQPDPSSTSFDLGTGSGWSTDTSSSSSPSSFDIGSGSSWDSGSSGSFDTGSGGSFD